MEQVGERIIYIKIKKYGLLSIGIYLFYVFLSFYVVFLIADPPEFTQENPEFVETDERVLVIDDGMEAWQARVDLIEASETSLDIAYYAMQGGESVELFYAHLLSAAERGVEVRFLVDGLFHGTWFDQDASRVFHEHSNIHLSYYEPLDLLRPWTWNNRLHDKMMIADGQYALIGGRNIGDKYFTPENTEGASYDRDLLILSPNNTEGIVEQMNNYFGELWNHEFVELQTKKELSTIGRKRAKRGKSDLEYIYGESENSLLLDADEKDWWEKAMEINSGYFIHNSLDRLYKEPAVWENILYLTRMAEKHVFF